jgi:hypothetical protein
VKVKPVNEMTKLCSWHHAMFSPAWGKHAAKIDNENCEECGWRRTPEGRKFMKDTQEALFGKKIDK